MHIFLGSMPSVKGILVSLDMFHQKTIQLVYVDVFQFSDVTLTLGYI